MERGFYIALPSNSSSKYYPQNTLSDFTTHLPKPIELEGRWEAALTEISMPSSFANVREDITVNIRTVMANLVNGKWIIGNERYLKTSHGNRTIQAGHYSIHELVEYINRKIEKLWRNRSEYKSLATPGKPDPLPIRFIHHPRMGKTSCVITKNLSVGETERLFVSLSTNVPKSEFDPYRLLGFTEEMYRKHVIEQQLHIFSPFTSDEFSGSHLAYIYTDVTAPQIVGDIETTLLRSCVVRNDHESNTFSEKFTLPYYLPVPKNRIQTIDVSIRDQIGRKIKFGSGTVILILHFKKVS